MSHGHFSHIIDIPIYLNQPYILVFLQLQICITMLVLLFLLGFTNGQVSPTWQRNNNIDAGQSKPINFDVAPADAKPPSSSFLYTQHYNKTDFAVVPRVVLGQLSYFFSTDGTNNNSLMGYNITMNSAGLLTFSYRVQTVGVIIVGLHFIYLAVSPIYSGRYLMQNYYIDFQPSDTVRNISEGSTRSKDVICTNPEGHISSSDFSGSEMILETWILGYKFTPSGVLSLNTSSSLRSTSQFTLSIVVDSSFSLNFLAITAILINTTQLMEYSYTQIIDLTYVSIIGGAAIVPISTTISDFNTQYFYRNTLTGNTGTKIVITAATYFYYNVTSSASSVSSGWSMGERSRVCPPGNDYYFYQNGTCIPSCPFYYFTNTTVTACVLCHYSCQNCTNQRDAQACSLCDSSYFRVLDSANGTRCSCEDGYFDNGTLLCVRCSTYCLTCQNQLSTGCLSCNATLNRVLSSGECLCSDGFAEDSSGLCLFNPVCGDGSLTSNQQCDDGNTFSGDGCSSTCQIEPDHSCSTNSSATPPSTCYYSSNIALTAEYIYKKPLENTVMVSLSFSASNINETILQSYLQGQSAISIEDIISSRRRLTAAGVDTVATTYDSTLKQATIEFSYNSDIDLTQMTLIFLSSPSTPYFSSTPPSQLSLHAPSNRFLTTFLSQSQIANLTILSYFYLAIIILLWLFIGISVIFNQSAMALQTFLILQVSYESLLQSKFIYEGWAGLVLFGKYTYGYNVGQQRNGEMGVLQLGGSLLNVINISALVMLAVTGIVVVIFLVETYSVKKGREERSQIGEKGSTAKMASQRIVEDNPQESYLRKRGIVVICLQIGLTLSFLTLKIMLMSICLTIKQSQSILLSLLPLLPLAISSIILWLCYYLSYNLPFLKELSYRRILRDSPLQQDNSACSTKYLSNLLVKYHYLFLYILFAVFSVINGLSYIQAAMYYLLAVGGPLWFVLICTNGTYLRTMHTVRSGFNVLAFVGMNALMLMQTLNILNPGQNNATGIAGLVILLLAFVGDVGVFIRIETKRRRHNKNKSNIKPQNVLMIGPNFDTEEPVNNIDLPPEMRREFEDEINVDHSQMGLAKQKSQGSEASRSQNQFQTHKKMIREQQGDNVQTKERQYQLQNSGQRLDRTKPFGFEDIRGKLQFQQLQSPKKQANPRERIRPEEEATEQNRFQQI